MPVSIELQSAIARQYAQLGDAVTNDPARERSVLAAGFRDRARVKLATFEYDPLSVLVQKIVVRGASLEVHAEYVGAHGRTAASIDHWINVDGHWRLLDRTNPH